MEENVKITCCGATLEIQFRGSNFFFNKIWRYWMFLVRKLTRGEKSVSKSDQAKKAQFKIWQVVNFFFKIWLHRKNFNSISTFFRTFFFKVCFLMKNFAAKSFFLNGHEKRKTCCFYGVNWVEKWFFRCKFFSKSDFFEKLISKYSF